jgi:GNAT superfamily N-acetyltransferase
MIRSLGLRSEIVALMGLSVVEDHPDRVVLRTPDQPDYWSANTVIFREAHRDAATELARFQADFPQAAHIMLNWDDTAPDDTRLAADFVPLGLTLDRTDVLALDQLALPPDVPGLTIDAVHHSADWDAVADIELATGIEDGHAAAPHLVFLQARIAGRQRQLAAGQGVWFLARMDGQPAACLGLLHGQGVARFQTVGTKAAFRKRGIAAALVAHATRWSLATDPTARPLILAETDAAPGRLYRRLGYRPVERIVTALKPGY